MNAVRLLRVAVLLCLICAFGPNYRLAAQNPVESPISKLTPADIQEGKALYQSQCAGCHGQDASGGMGPNIRGAWLRRGDDGMFSVIRNGIPGTGMGPVMWLNDKRAWQVVGYLRSLSDSGSAEAAKGDATKGKELYASNGCAVCHAVAGAGGVIGPELTFIGRMRSQKYLHDFLLNPGKNPPSDPGLPERAANTGYLMTSVTIKEGRKITGVRVNEDSFTLQLRDMAGRYYSFNKADLTKIEPQPGKSFMPSFTNLSAGQLDDLVAYLASLKGAQ